MATNPKFIRALIDPGSDLLEVVIERDVTDALSGVTDRRQDTVRGKLSDLTGLNALRNNVVAWVKVQTGFAGAVDTATPPAP